jgi:EpsI family protein
LAVDIDHVVYGFVFLSFVTLSLLGLGVWIRDRVPMPLRPMSAMIGHPVPRRGLQIYCAIAAIAIVFAAHFLSAMAKTPPADRQVTLQGVEVGRSWRVEKDEPPLWMPDFHGMDAALQRTFSGEDGTVALNVAYYTYQREGSEAVSDLNAISREGSPWKVLQARRLAVATRTGSLPINQIILGGRDQAILVWYWYRIGGEVTNSRLKAKLLEAKALMTGGERDAAIVAVSAKVVDNVDGTAASLRGFLEQAVEDGGMILQIDMLPVRAGEQHDQRTFDLMGN